MSEDVKKADTVKESAGASSVQEQLATSQMLMQQQMAQAQMLQQQTQQQMLLQMQKKSMAIALVLAFFFGPLGLFYSTVRGGVIMLVIGIVVAIVTMGFGALLMWIPCMIWAYIAVDKHNKQLMATGVPPVE